MIYIYIYIKGPIRPHVQYHFEALIRDGALVRIGQGSRLDFFCGDTKKNHVFSGLLFLLWAYKLL